MSLRAAATTIALRALAKPLLARIQDPGFARSSFELAARFIFRPAPNALYLPAPPGANAGLWISSGRVAPRRVILYLHGGAYIAGSPHTHREMIARISRRSGLRVFAPDYPLVPEAVAPAAFDAALSAWRGLVAIGYRPSDIVLGGDSAGGGLALALLGRLCAEGTPPAGLFAFSPWTDLTLSGRSLQANAAKDPLLPAGRVAEIRDMVIGSLAPEDPRISPVFARFPGCPPVFLQASESEILRDDTLRMAERLKAEGARVTVDLWPPLPHVWPILYGHIPEAAPALDRIAAFLRGLTPLAR
ncbi:alpha/beta hydrolase [Ostreiculturibacter nitratireducens]|uniref:alpha/beta hydrolase n=1 Tax=Ostreiculturibacter nitratireducens TaxID=3075226 RepID=UPI0031B59221